MGKPRIAGVIREQRRNPQGAGWTSTQGGWRQRGALSFSMMLGSKKVAVLSFLAHRSCEGVWEVCFPVNERIGGRARRLLYSLLAPGMQITARSCPPVRSAAHLYILPRRMLKASQPPRP